jgi:hypothetical protein
MPGALGKIRRRFDWDVIVGVTDLPTRCSGEQRVAACSLKQAATFDL